MGRAKRLILLSTEDLFESYFNTFAFRTASVCISLYFALLLSKTDLKTYLNYWESPMQPMNGFIYSLPMQKWIWSAIFIFFLPKRFTKKLKNKEVYIIRWYEYKFRGIKDLNYNAIIWLINKIDDILKLWNGVIVFWTFGQSSSSFSDRVKKKFDIHCYQASRIN